VSAPTLVTTNGRVQAVDLAAVLAGPRSRFLDLLPGIFGEGEEADFLGRYLLIYETILDGFDQLIAGLPDRFDSSVAPEPFLPWLASWVGLVLDEGWPVARRRAVLARAMELHRWRGTVRGLREHLQLYTGYTPEIIEQSTGMTLGAKTQLGYETILGRGDRPHHFSVVLRVPDPAAFDRARLRTIVEAQRPAHTTYSLFILPGPGEAADEAAAVPGRHRAAAD
jgi:phage tail-like protein